VKAALAQTGCEKVDLVGHSMGGLVVRYYVEKLSGAASVNAAVTLGAPHQGSKTAVFGITKSAEQFSPDSALITELNEAPPTGDAADMTSVWSDFDSVILPHESARLPEPYTSVKVGGLGHVAMLFSGRVFDETLRAISTNLPPRDFSDGVD
jgi:triacylglycerol esterase/lipase EstA (alpha/beta hydrolase family)